MSVRRLNFKPILLMALQQSHTLPAYSSLRNPRIIQIAEAMAGFACEPSTASTASFYKEENKRGEIFSSTC
jgi:hypothetical protein